MDFESVSTVSDTTLKSFMEASPIENDVMDDEFQLSTEFSAAYIQQYSKPGFKSGITCKSGSASPTKTSLYQCCSNPVVSNSQYEYSNKRSPAEYFTSSTTSVGSLGSITETDKMDNSSTASIDMSSNNSIDEASSPECQSRAFVSQKEKHNNGSVPCLQLSLAHNPMICGCSNCQKTRSAFSANDIPTLTLPSRRPRGSTNPASQRKRSSAISAKSKSSYLEQYKRCKEDYFRSRIDGVGVAEPILAPMNMNRWSTYK